MSVLSFLTVILLICDSLWLQLFRLAQPKALLSSPIPLFLLNSITTFLLAHPAPATLTSLLSCKQAGQIATSGPLQWCFTQSETLFSRYPHELFSFILSCNGIFSMQHTLILLKIILCLLWFLPCLFPMAITTLQHTL